MRPDRPSFHDLLVQRREKAMMAAEKRELRELSLVYIHYQPLPVQSFYNRELLGSAIAGFKQTLIVRCLNEAIILRGVEHTLIRPFDTNDFTQHFKDWHNMMVLVLFGWAHPDDNEDITQDDG